MDSNDESLSFQSWVVEVNAVIILEYSCHLILVSLLKLIAIMSTINLEFDSH